MDAGKLKPGSRFGKYRVVDSRGGGFVADLYEARVLDRQGEPGETVALKVLRSRGGGDDDDEDLAQLFEAQANIGARLKHPNLVRFLERGEVDGRHFLAYELINGVSYAEVLDAQRKRGVTVPTETAVYVAHELVRGLEHMHGAGVLHRTVSPRHVMLSEAGAVKLLGLGGALAGGIVDRTRAAMVHGDMSYLSPEQLHGLTIDHRADIFSAVLILYETLVGAAARGGKGKPKHIDQIMAGRLEPASKARPSLDAEIDRLVTRGLSIVPEERQASASELADALAAWLQRRGPRAGAAAVAELVAAVQGKKAPARVSAPPAMRPMQPAPAPALRPAPPADEVPRAPSAIPRPARPSAPAKPKPIAPAPPVKGPEPPVPAVQPLRTAVDPSALAAPPRPAPGPLKRSVDVEQPASPDKTSAISLDWIRSLEDPGQMPPEERTEVRTEQPTEQPTEETPLEEQDTSDTTISLQPPREWSDKDPGDSDPTSILPAPGRRRPSD